MAACELLATELRLDRIEAELAIELPPHLRSFARAHAQGLPPPAAPEVLHRATTLATARAALVHPLLADRGLALVRLVAPVALEADPAVAAARAAAPTWAALAALAAARDAVARARFGRRAIDVMHRLHGSAIDLASLPGGVAAGGGGAPSGHDAPGRHRLPGSGDGARGGNPPGGGAARRAQEGLGPPESVASGGGKRARGDGDVLAGSDGNPPGGGAARWARDSLGPPESVASGGDSVAPGGGDALAGSDGNPPGDEARWARDGLGPLEHVASGGDKRARGDGDVLAGSDGNPPGGSAARWARDGLGPPEHVASSGERVAPGGGDVRAGGEGDARRLPPPVAGWFEPDGVAVDDRAVAVAWEALRVRHGVEGIVRFERAAGARPRAFVVEPGREVVIAIPTQVAAPAVRFAVLHELGHAVAALALPPGIPRVVDEAAAAYVARAIERDGDPWFSPRAAAARERRSRLARLLDGIERALPDLPAPPMVSERPPWGLWNDPGAQAAYVAAEALAEAIEGAIGAAPGPGALAAALSAWRDPIDRLGSTTWAI